MIGNMESSTDDTKKDVRFFSLKNQITKNNPKGTLVRVRKKKKGKKKKNKINSKNIAVPQKNADRK